MLSLVVVEKRESGLLLGSGEVGHLVYQLLLDRSGLGERVIVTLPEEQWRAVTLGDAWILGPAGG